jgi:hypothetical protein
MHTIQASLVAETPWQWQPATVRRLLGLEVCIEDDAGRSAVVWHHAPLGKRLQVGDPVLLHAAKSTMRMFRGSTAHGSSEGSIGVSLVSVLILANTMPAPTPPTEGAAYRPDIAIVEIASGEGISAPLPPAAL